MPYMKESMPDRLGSRTNSLGSKPNRGGFKKGIGRPRKRPVVPTVPDEPIKVENDSHVTTAPVIDTMIKNGEKSNDE